MLFLIGEEEMSSSTPKRSTIWILLSEQSGHYKARYGYERQRRKELNYNFGQRCLEVIGRKRNAQMYRRNQHPAHQTREGESFEAEFCFGSGSSEVDKERKSNRYCGHCQAKHERNEHREDEDEDMRGYVHIL